MGSLLSYGLPGLWVPFLCVATSCCPGNAEFRPGAHLYPLPIWSYPTRNRGVNLPWKCRTLRAFRYTLAGNPIVLQETLGIPFVLK